MSLQAKLDKLKNNPALYTGLSAELVDLLSEIVSSSGAIESVTGTAVDVTDPANPVINNPYKRYFFKLKGNGFYFHTVLDNTIPGDIYYSKVSTGLFRLTSSVDAFTANKTTISGLLNCWVPFVDEGFDKKWMYATVDSTSIVQFSFHADNAGMPGVNVDPVFPSGGLNLEVRVYN